MSQYLILAVIIFETILMLELITAGVLLVFYVERDPPRPLRAWANAHFRLLGLPKI